MKNFIKEHPYMTMFIVLSILATIRYFFLKKIIIEAINVDSPNI
jgi:hypothetical protein